MRGDTVNGVALPETALSRLIEPLLVRGGRAASWLWVVLLVVIVANVALRYIFGEGRVELEELQWHLNSIAFLFAITYAYVVDAHIRIDLVSSRLEPKHRVWIELYGTLLLLLPFILVVVWYSLPFVASSFALGEISQSPGGLPFRWFVKGVLTFAMFTLLIAVLARLTRLWAFLVEAAR